MIESLAEHGVDPSDLVPALMTTHTVNNPDFDPKEKERVDLEEALRKEAEADDEAEREAKAEEERRVVVEDQGASDTETEPPPPYEVEVDQSASRPLQWEKQHHHLPWNYSLNRSTHLDSTTTTTMAPNPH